MSAREQAIEAVAASVKTARTAGEVTVAAIERAGLRIVAPQDGASSRLVDALRLIDRNGCETFTRGRCLDANSGRKRGAAYGAEAWCEACIARDALDHSAPEVAERPVEIVTGSEAAELRVRAMEAVNDLTDTGMGDGFGRPVVEAIEAAGIAFVRAPEPVAPPKVGDVIETAAQLDALPDEAVVRTRVGGVARHVPDGWELTGSEHTARARALSFPARVLDLGGDS